jgi:hypothetical protein
MAWLQVYEEVLLPQLPKLPEAVRDKAMLVMLQHLPELQRQDQKFMKLLAQVSGHGPCQCAGQLK